MRKPPETDSRAHRSGLLVPQRDKLRQRENMDTVEVPEHKAHTMNERLATGLEYLPVEVAPKLLLGRAAARESNAVAEQVCAALRVQPSEESARDFVVACGEILDGHAGKRENRTHIFVNRRI